MGSFAHSALVRPSVATFMRARMPAAPHTLMLTFSSWQKRFGGRPEVIGQSLTLNELPYTIIGVLPQDFQFAPMKGQNSGRQFIPPAAISGEAATVSRE